MMYEQLKISDLRKFYLYHITLWIDYCGLSQRLMLFRASKSGTATFS